MRKSRETNLDEIIADQKLSGSVSIDDLVPSHRVSQVSFADMVDQPRTADSSFTSGS